MKDANTNEPLGHAVVARTQNRPTCLRKARTRSSHAARRQWWRYVGPLIASVLALANYSFASDHPPRFDPDKARQLSSERRRQHDVRFFNEMYLHANHPLEPRYQLFRRMAEDGFEVAYLALRLYDIRHSDLPKRDPEALNRLKQLAAEGDVSAKCFYAIFAWRLEDRKSDIAERLPSMLAAAEAKQPFCTGAFGGYVGDGSALPPGFERWKQVQADPRRATAMAIAYEEQAAKSGDLRSQSVLALRYRLGTRVTQDLGRARCWAAIAVNTSENAAKIAGQAVFVEHEIRWQIAREGLDPAAIKRYSEASWCSEVVTNSSAR